MNRNQVNELLLQALTHEKGGVLVYQAALRCVVNQKLRTEWEKYLDETRTHVRVLTEVCEQLELDTGHLSPGCRVVKHMGHSLVEAMEQALKAGDPGAAQLVAAECVVLAETKDHLNWELISLCGEKATGDLRKLLSEAAEEVTEQEAEHLFHTKGWCRELWIESLGMKAVLPPPEEKKDVKTAIGASRAEQQSMKSR